MIEPLRASSLAKGNEGNEAVKTTKKRTLTTLALLIAATLLGGCTLQIDQNNERVKSMNRQTTAASGYASVNGLEMYYESHGTGGIPLVLLHGAFSATGTSFGEIIPSLAKNRQVISFEQQAHGHTADIDRPLTVEQMADDTAAALRQLGIEKADVFGYSMGAGIALQLAIKHPDLVHKAVFASVSYNDDGLHPGHAEGMAFMQPEMLVGTPWHDEYVRIAPNPDDFPTLFTKVMAMTATNQPLSAETLQQIEAPVLVIMGDSDIVRPEHAVEMFRLFGGGVNGDVAGMPNSQLAILPGTAHTMIPLRADWLAPMITAFLDAPLPEAQ
ncbi:MAG: alpha/beta hydrolase [Caldilineaceae bacterium]|nr:alpha/beta hydrolase [Caldilineaceae bacterium]